MMMQEKEEANSVDHFAVLQERLGRLDNELKVCGGFFAEKLSGLDKDQHSETIAEIRALTAKISRRANALMGLCGSFKNGTANVRVHVAASRPLEVTTTHSVFPLISKHVMKKKNLHLLCTAPSLVWLLSGSVIFLMWFDVVAYSSSLALVGFGLLPIIVFLLSCCSRHLLVRLFTSFQTIFVMYNIVVLVGSVCLLWRNHLHKIVTLIFSVPSFALSGCLDAFPESGRVVLSRVFFLFNVVALLLLLSGIALEFSSYDELEVVVSGWSFRMSAMACSAINSLLPFGLKNLFKSFLRPGSLA